MTPEFDAVILAAGLSSRMQGFKPLYRLGDVTVLRRLVDLYKESGAREVLVVAGHNVDLVISEVLEAAARPVLNEQFATGMFSSVLAGVQALRAGAAAFFIHPVDIPLVRDATIRRLWRTFLKQSPAVAHPCFLGRRGHPPLLNFSLRPSLLSWKGQSGLRGFFDHLESNTPEKVVDVTVADEGVLMDMDTEADFARIADRWQRLDLPSRGECSALMEIAGTPSRAVEHGKAVAHVALALGRMLNERRGDSPLLNLERIERAALVHDIAKGQRQHEAEGARILREAGFHDIAQEVAVHRDIVPANGQPRNEADVVFMADKLVAGTEFVPISERYGRVMQKHGQDPEARTAIEHRMDNALAMQRDMEGVFGGSLNDLAAKALEEI